MDKRYLGTAKKLSLILGLTMCFNTATFAAPINETPENIYYGSENASVMLNNIDYNDVRNSNTYAKEAIYEAGALDVLKGYGAKQFGLKGTLSKQEALALAYRAAGREAEAQKLGEGINQAKTKADQKTDPMNVWADGYLQLGATEGLITQQDLADAFTTDPTALTATSFYRTAPAQRQDMADWLAKALKLAPTYGQQKMFNSFADWRSADAAKIPYIESILQNNIMNGNGNGSFNPRQSLTREQAAQIIKNAEKYILTTLGDSKKSGVVESIATSKDFSQGKNITKNTINLRDDSGKLDQIVVENSINPTNFERNEQSGAAITNSEKELVVYRGGTIGKSSLLKVGDDIQYIFSTDNKVKFVKAVPVDTDTIYYGAKINSVDKDNSQLDVTKLFKMDYPDINLAKSSISYDLGSEQKDAKYKCSATASFLFNNERGDISKVVPHSNVIIGVKNNMITLVKADRLTTNTGEWNVVKGIVEDNDPSLGYMTLYFEDGSGTSQELEQQLMVFRTYNYSNPSGMDVQKNKVKATINDIEPGDTAFLRLDNEGNIESVSAVDNYTVKYAEVKLKRPSNLMVQYEDGTSQDLDIDNSVLFVSDRKLISYERLKDGDNIKLILHITPKSTKVKEITLEGDEHLIANIYKGTVNNIDDISKKLVVNNIEILDNGKWAKTGIKGASDIKMSDDASLYSGETKLDIGKINKYLNNSEAYIAVEKDYGGKETAVFVSFRNDDDTEVPYDDSVANTTLGSGELSLDKGNNIKCNSGTIVIKDGRLVSPNSIENGDMTYVVANRNYGDGEYYAGVVQISERPNTNFIQIYRVKLASINENEDFGVESYSQLEGLNWEFYNTPKIFKLTNETRMIDDTGVVNLREFIDYGEENYKDTYVYVLSDGVNAKLISTAPFGPDGVFAKGDIYIMSGVTTGEDGLILEGPTSFIMRNAKIYDTATFVWEGSNDITLNILTNSIILKGNKIVEPSELEKGDKLRVYKNGNNTTGDAYVVIVEN